MAIPGFPGSQKETMDWGGGKSATAWPLCSSPYHGFQLSCGWTLQGALESAPWKAGVYDCLFKQLVTVHYSAFQFKVHLRVYFGCEIRYNIELQFFKCSYKRIQAPPPPIFSIHLSIGGFDLFTYLIDLIEIPFVSRQIAPIKQLLSWFLAPLHVDLRYVLGRIFSLYFCPSWKLASISVVVVGSYWKLVSRILVVELTARFLTK